MAGTNGDDDDDDVFHDRAGNYCTIHLLNERSVTTFAKCVYAQTSCFVVFTCIFPLITNFAVFYHLMCDISLLLAPLENSRSLQLSPLATDRQRVPFPVLQIRPSIAYNRETSINYSWHTLELALVR